MIPRLPAILEHRVVMLEDGGFAVAKGRVVLSENTLNIEWDALPGKYTSYGEAYNALPKVKIYREYD